jgi:hypothetical protein
VLTREYLALVLRLDRLAPALADAGGVPRELRRAVAAEPAPTPSDLVREAGRLACRVADTELDPARRRFLTGQLRAVECTARRLTGQPIPFRREVEECFDVEVTMGDPDGYRAVHAELDALLPGPGPLTARLAAYRRAQEVPRDRLGAALATLAELLGRRTRAVVPLPAAESVAFRIVDDAPWSALHQYRGGLRSRVTVNAAARPRRAQLARLVAHEAYPGHHTQRCRKESGGIELGVIVANSPQSVVGEGAAELGLAAVLGPGWGPEVADALAELGLPFDGELAQRVDGALARLAAVRLDAALLLHDRRAADDEVLGHLRRWLLIDDRRARQVLRFVAHPVWRAYTTTYVAGTPLLQRWWARDPGPSRLRRLLDEPLTPNALRAELTG